jgi:subtilisin family serine protease
MKTRRFHGLIVALIAGSAGCGALRGPVASADNPLMLNGSLAVNSTRDGPTLSWALDRITKRRPELSGAAPHAGNGDGVVIYVFDGGVMDDPPELAGRVRTGFDAFPSTPRICNSHGTAVAGAAAGTTLGVAPAAQIVDVKIIDCATQHGTIGAIVAAAEWTVADHRKHPRTPAIANWSFIVDTSRVVPEIGRAIDMLQDAGILVVAAAGNFEIDACRVSPANARRALVVGASGISSARIHDARQDVRARNSAGGPCIDLYAPGDSVLLPSQDRGSPANNRWNGTSMAAGYVSGAAALVLERVPWASPAAVKAMLLRTATPDVVDERPDTAVRPQGRLLYIGSAP